MFVDIGVEIRGKSPLLMHRYAGEQPSAEKAPRGKKTETHIKENRVKQWNENAWFQNGTFHIPVENVEAMLFTAARKIRKGQDFKESVAVVEDFIPLIVYESPEDKKGTTLNGERESYYKPEYIDIRGVVIKGSRVDRCRPIFRDWGLKFTIRYDEQVLNEKDVFVSLERGTLGDFRPRFGRFRIVKFDPAQAVAA